MCSVLGAGIVLGGIVVVLIPTFFSSPTATDAAAAAAAASTESSNEMLWILVLVVSCVPMCLSSVYKEKVRYDFAIYCSSRSYGEECIPQ